MSEAGLSLGAWSLLLLTSVLTVTAALLSALLERSGPIRLRHWAEQAGGSLRKLYRRPARFETFRLVLSTVVRLGLVAIALIAVQSSHSLWFTGLTLAVAVVVVETVSRLPVVRDPEESLRRLIPAYRVALVIARPLMFLARPLVPSAALKRRIEEGEIDDASEGEIEAFIDVGQREGILEPGEDELVKGVVEFGDTLVKSVMTPRTEVDLAPSDSDLEALLDLFMASGHSRIPLYGESMDEITGILHVRDLLAGLRSPERPTARALAMEPFIVPETKPISELLREFQARRQQLAVVVDEFGGAAGVVTIEDLLEEIVGDIADEHDVQGVERISLGDGAWQLAGACEVEELERLFDIDLAESSSETVGGLVFAALGYLPDPGVRVARHGLDFEVLEVEDRRIRSVRVELAAEE